MEEKIKKNIKKILKVSGILVILSVTIIVAAQAYNPYLVDSRDYQKLIIHSNRYSMPHLIDGQEVDAIFVEWEQNGTIAGILLINQDTGKIMFKAWY